LKCGAVVVVVVVAAAANMAIPAVQAHMWLKLCAVPTLADANIQFVQAGLHQHHQTVSAALVMTVMYRAFN
jgi:hypothetical protein